MLAGLYFIGGLYNLYQKYTKVILNLVPSNQSSLTNFIMFNSPGLVIHHLHLLYLKLNNLYFLKAQKAKFVSYWKPAFSQVMFILAVVSISILVAYVIAVT